MLRISQRMLGRFSVPLPHRRQGRHLNRRGCRRQHGHILQLVAPMRLCLWTPPVQDRLPLRDGLEEPWSQKLLPPRGEGGRGCLFLGSNVKSIFTKCLIDALRWLEPFTNADRLH